MKKKLSTILVALTFTFGYAFGQDYTFKVLANKGKNQIKRQSGELEPMKTGSEIFDQEEIISSEGAYIGLVHKSGKTTELRGASTRKVEDIASTINTSGSSAVSRYAQFIAAKMSESTTTGNRDRTNTIGAVSRSFSEFVVFLPGTSLEVYSDEALVRWIPPGSAGSDAKFIVTISNVFGEELVKEVTQDSVFTLKFGEIENPSNFYIFNVKSAEDERVASEDYGMKKVGAKEKPEVAEALEALMPELSEESPITNLVLAGFYEESGLMVDAVTQYERLMMDSPEDFREIYERFLKGYEILPSDDE